MANQNLKSVVATVSGSPFYWGAGTEVEAWILRNFDASNSLTFNVGGRDVVVSPKGFKRVNCVDDSITITGNGEFNVIALENGEAEVERLATGTGSGSGSTPSGETVTAATSSGSPHDITEQKTVSNPTVSAAAFFRLPDAATGDPWVEYVIKDGKKIAGTAANIITVTSAGGTLDGQTSETISTDGGAKRFFSDGTNWIVL